MSRFDRDGFIHLGSVLPPQTVRSFEAEITAKVVELNAMHLPMGGITPWHADQYYWPFTSTRTCTIGCRCRTLPSRWGP